MGVFCNFNITETSWVFEFVLRGKGKSKPIQIKDAGQLFELIEDWAESQDLEVVGGISLPPRNQQKETAP